MIPKYDPTCPTCREHAGRSRAGTTDECRDHLVARLAAERDAALARLARVEFRREMDGALRCPHCGVTARPHAASCPHVA